MKKLIKNPLIIFVLAIILIAGSSVGGASAAFVYTNAADQVNFSTAQISVDLLEAQSKKTDAGLVADTDSLKSVYDNGDNGLKFPCIDRDSFKIGVKYPELVAVRNNSNNETGYSEYVRVIVTKSWINKEGKKDTTLSPELIKLETDGSWYHDASADTREQSVYYLKSPLANGATQDFIKSITIDNQVVTEGAVTKPATDQDGNIIANTIVTEYRYDGQTFNVELEVDAVQTHNAVAAIQGAWGITVTTDKADDGNITSINGQSVN